MRKGGSSCGSHKKKGGTGFFNKLAVPGALLGMRLSMKKSKKTKKTKTRKTRKAKKTKK